MDKPSPHADRPSTSTRTPMTNTLVASETALAQVEAQRLRGLMIGIASSSLVFSGIVFLLGLLGGDPLAVRVHAGALLTCGVASAIAAVWFHPEVAKWLIVSQVIVLISGLYFWGIFSAYIALLPLTVYILAGSATRLQLMLATPMLVAMLTVFGLATVFGYIESRGLVEPVLSRTPIEMQVIAVLLIQGITVGAIVAGRAARKASLEVLDAHNKALVELAQREAQLAEAYAEARAAREAGQGGVGRFTEQQIDEFKLGEVLGRGAMGEVYAAHRVNDETPLAMKILAPHLLRDAGARDRFLRESAIVSSINSPHVVRVLAVSHATAALPYIVMERLDGVDLAQMLKRQAVRPLDEIQQIIEQVAKGLDAAHKAGIIHRDLKPSNIYATGEGDTRIWKLLDFGASKWRDSDGTLTQDNIVGTPGYMAPEQALGRSVDQRCDVYALGVILYRLLTGVPAVVPGEVPAMLQEVAYRMPVQPSRRGNVSAQVEAVLAVALAKQAMHRFATAGELSYALKTAIGGKLDKGIVHRAESLLADQPWGTWSRQSTVKVR